ncbi:hypothetical protein LOTGIDRAFT_154376 [Lottia gigantea]|uniref:Uncharacterized protein n=1 Tax=Lottia gigantea TaxID=225164 RepID=V4A2X1_LOTGI|nr:hypothetical protein LOTGIDRAFT_154376 [Lottia gigantea]ESO89280.1 hypothetical protein LOTGIDRAFT_154376 [Lottia gigantea]
MATKLAPICHSQRITAKLDGVSGYDIQTSTKTVYLKTRGIHVRVTETPKEALARNVRQTSPDAVSRSSSATRKENVTEDLRLMVHGVVSSKPADEDPEVRKSEISSYAIRQQYGQHLEKNWYKSMVREMNTKNKESVTQQSYPFTPEMFYSPEPETDSGDEDAVKFSSEFRVVVQNSTVERSLSGYESEAIVDDEPISLKYQSTKFVSMDVLVSDQESGSESDIEFIMKNGGLLQKRVKNKMHAKRQRQMTRFEKLHAKPDEVSDEDDDYELENMTDKELRAMRLKLKKPKWKLKLKGIARFRQVVRSICILMFFRRVIKEIKRERKARMRRNKRHKSLGGFLSGEDDECNRLSKLHHYKTLKERFLDEIGWKLVEQVSNLAIKDGFGYDIRDELASGERRSRYLRVLEEWFANDSQEATQIEYIPNRRTSKRLLKKTIKRSTSCPELIKPKQYRVLHSPVKFLEPKTDKEFSKKKGKGGKRKTNKPLRYQKNNDDDDDYAIGSYNEGNGRRSSFELGKKSGGALDLRDLLKDVHIPAKEIKIQIAERKMRRNRKNSRQAKKKGYIPYDAKKAMEANRFKIPDFEINLSPTNTSPVDEDEDKSSSPTHENSESPTESKTQLDKLHTFSVRNGPFVNSSVSWNKSKQKNQNTWSNEELDREIQRAGSLFLEMRHCRYIRWYRLGQAMVSRMLELENEVMYGFTLQSKPTHQE